MENMDKGNEMILDKKKNYIEFCKSGALDFYEACRIELSLEPKEGFTEIHPLDLLWIISFRHLGLIIQSKFSQIVGKIPHISDKNPDLKNRFDKIYYKCYSIYSHSHSYPKENITQLTLGKFIKTVKQEKLDII